MNYFTKAKPYNSLNEYYKTKYDHKVSKIALNANFSCPNKDGKKGYGGCIFCLSGSESSIINRLDDLEKQFNDSVEIINNKWPDSLYIPYLQANSNTYDSLDNLKLIYEKCISLSDKVVGLDISTRADCLDEEKVKYLTELNKRVNVTVELGLETTNEATSKYLNRCQTNDEIIKAVNLLRKYNIEVVLHIINGLPGEDINDMLNNIKFINKLDVQGIKIHTLLILKNTKLAKIYEEGNFHILSMDEYVDIVCQQIALLKDNIIIHRLCSDATKDVLITPIWSRNKKGVMNEIDKRLRTLGWYQGMNYTK
ncbi:MAG: TIGR01212 family radical SAM protein [Acholeplasmatales bacterium]|nr:TIGR01212 family radical SAM protein [Acholeplasmatales bacterium]